MDVAENRKEIFAEVAKMAEASGRKPADVRVIAVTKSVDEKTTRELAETGQKDMAENRVDKFLAKKAALKDFPEITWHLIGTLQRRKVKEVINEVDYFHALDSLRLASEIQKRADHAIRCLIEVNVSGEESKHGVSPAELVELVQSMKELDKVQIVGLMTMAPLEAEAPEILHLFQELKKLQEKVHDLGLSYAPCTELSMGMSNDYPLAVEAGATMIRVGRRFFK
ncbi:MAG: YggS family pyridoxal phosphate-dependent enzyme [Enterococcaceae bacterium]|nr:YggS family pyridoxal phosphate-dependent enzyme [Enterococcaceae bacterium]MCI1919109.1 YggS family pyridoxal phosphate-dependent enzyme [Enterococcaceae bacterium]